MGLVTWGNKIWGEKDKHELWALGVEYGGPKLTDRNSGVFWCYNNPLWNL